MAKKHQTQAVVAAAGRIGFVPSRRIERAAVPADLVDPVVQFAVFGDPSPQGSKAAMGNGKLRESSEGLKPWRDAVRNASLLVTRTPGWQAINEPVFVGITFTMPPTAAATRRGDTYNTGTPDLDKLLRAIGDALQPPAQKGKLGASGLPTAIEKRAREAERTAARRLSVLHDDSRIVGFVEPQKVYPGTIPTSLKDHPGAFIEVWRAADLRDPIGRQAIRHAPASRVMQITAPAEGWPEAFRVATTINDAPRIITLAHPLALHDAAIVAHALMASGPAADLQVAAS